MHTTNIRKVGGSLMLAVPPALLEVLHLSAGGQVMLSVENGRLIAEPRQKPRYSLAELLAQSDYTSDRSAEEQAWLDSPAVGSEHL